MADLHILERGIPVVKEDITTGGKVKAVEKASRAAPSLKSKISSNLLYHMLTEEKSFIFLSALGAMLFMVEAMTVSRL